jgi:hypothetical protein
VTEQHFDMTQLAHVAVVNAIPQAAVMPPPPPPPPDPLPPPDDRHALLQACWRQLWIPCAAERHEGLAVTFAMQASDCWAELLYCPFAQ